jgi:ATP-dependent HslUV protease ATP-binding subunit HslU
VVFIDEIDKLCGPRVDIGRDVSGEGVQRDLLPLLEGTTVMTRYGSMKTEHILFIAAGTFSQNKPSELIPELQGRLPLRVELNPLSQQDLERILVEPRNSLTKQYQALLATEGIALSFTEDGIGEIARLAVLMNERVENIGARRLFTIMERLLEDLSFTASERKGEQVIVDANYVWQQVGSLIKDENLSRYIL